MELIALMLSALSCSCQAQARAEPCLVFSRMELPAIRQRVAAGQSALVWQELKARADDYCTPGSTRYADPEKVDEPVEGMRIQVLAHAFGRKLTEWAQTLGFAYQLTGDSRYADHGVEVLLAAARKLPAADERVAKSFAGARGDLMRGFAVGLDWLGEAMTEEQRRPVEEVAAEYVRVIVAEGTNEQTWWVPHHNFMGVAFGAAGCLSLKLRDRFPAEAPKWIDACAERIRTWLDKGFDDQGAYFEGTGYAAYGLTNAVLFAHALKRDGGPDLFDHPHLRQVPHFFAMSLLPGDRVFEARNDANYAGLGDPFMLRLASAHDSGLAKWLHDRCGSEYSPLRIVWDNDTAPADPASAGEPLAEHFAGRGLCVFRTGWDQGDVMFSTEAGPFYRVTHNQADKGHFTLYGLGQRWAIDSGYGNNRQPGGRDQTVAHNCVLVDGEGQALSGAGAGTNGKIVTFENNDRYGYALCDATEAYNTNDKGQPGAKVRHALRHCLFVRPSGGVPAYAVVLDDIGKDDAEREFTWLLHTDEHNSVEIDESGATIVPQSTSGGAFVETPAETTGTGACEWKLSVVSAGDYVVWARVRAAGDEAAKSDSFMVQIDDGKPVAWHMPGSRSWTWGKVADGVPAKPVSFPLEAGQHTLRFLTREPGAQVDRVLVTADANAAPPFVGKLDAIQLEAEDGALTPPMRSVREDAATPPRLKLFMHAASPIRFEVDAYETHPRLKATCRAVKPDFAAVMVPLPGGTPAPEVAFAQTADALRVTVRWERGTDEITWPGQGDRAPVVRRQ
jgi:hypothetical protein